MFLSFPFSLSELNHSARDTFFKGKVMFIGDLNGTVLVIYMGYPFSSIDCMTRCFD